MITRENGNIVLIDEKGRHVYGVMTPEYGRLGVILAAQKLAAEANQLTATNYNDLVTKLQVSVDAGRPAEQPPKPLMKVVADDGTESHAPFDPPLHDLKTAPPPTAPDAGSPFAKIPVGTGGLTVDEERAQYNMTAAIYHHLFPDAV